MPGAGTAVTLVAVAAALTALNANLYGASRMAYSLAERGEAPRLLASVSRARVQGERSDADSLADARAEYRARRDIRAY